MFKSKGDSPILSVIDDAEDIVKTLVAEDNGVLGLRVQMLKYSTSTLQWERWDGKMDTVVSGDLIVAVDEVEAKLDTLIGLLQDSLVNYQLANLDVSSDPMYFGYLDKSGNYYIKKINITAGTVGYIKGTSGYSTAWTGRAALSYDTFDTEF